MNKLLSFLSTVIAILFGVVLFENNKNKQLKSQLNTEKFKEQDNTLTNQVNSNNQAIQQEQQHIEELKKPTDEALAPNSVSDYWNKKS